MRKFLQSTLINDELISRGKLPLLNPSQEHRLRRGNYKKAEAYAQMENCVSESIRSYIARGAFDEAQEQIELTEDHIECEFERARILCYSGKFTEALLIIDGFYKRPEILLVSKMTAHQMRALCFYELGDYSQACAQVDRVLSLESLFPSAEASLFARCTLARCYGRMGSWGLAQQEKWEIWNRISKGLYALNNKYQLIMYLRMSCELQRLENITSDSKALAGLWLSRQMGSPVHEGLFILELTHSQNSNLRLIAKKDLTHFVQRFQCVSYYSKQTGQILGQELRDGPTDLYHSCPDKLVFLNEGYVFNFKEDSLSEVSLTDQNQQILKTIENTKMAKEILYKKVWSHSEYHPLENDSAIRTALRRIRKQTGIDIKSEGSSLSIPGTVIL